MCGRVKIEKDRRAIANGKAVNCIDLCVSLSCQTVRANTIQTVTVQLFRSRKRFLETFFRLLPTQKKQETNNCVNNDIFTVRAGSVACSSRCCSCGAWCDIGEGVILWGRREGVETSAGVLWEGGM